MASRRRPHPYRRRRPCRRRRGARGRGRGPAAGDRRATPAEDDADEKLWGEGDRTGWEGGKKQRGGEAGEGGPAGVRPRRGRPARQCAGHAAITSGRTGPRCTRTTRCILPGHRLPPPPTVVVRAGAACGAYAPRGAVAWCALCNECGGANRVEWVSANQDNSPGEPFLRNFTTLNPFGAVQITHDGASRRRAWGGLSRPPPPVTAARRAAAAGRAGVSSTCAGRLAPVALGGRGVCFRTGSSHRQVWLERSVFIVSTEVPARKQE